MINAKAPLLPVLTEEKSYYIGEENLKIVYMIGSFLFDIFFRLMIDESECNPIGNRG